ncbi:hypothetical protein GCM10028818_33110 [Spirosoma horti]
MTYINLRHIGELAIEALSNYQLAESYCYNTSSQTDQIPDDIFVVLAKTYRQAQNLHTKLTRLHQVCTDFIAENFDPYIDEHEKWAENEDQVFNPFECLERCFDCASVEDLPDQIEQYRELLSLSHSFGATQQIKNKAIQDTFGDLLWYYAATDTEGETVMISERELPESFRHQQAVKQEISDIQVEFCLDGYNAFYEHATGLLSAYNGGDVQACAQRILLLYAKTTK